MNLKFLRNLFILLICCSFSVLAQNPNDTEVSLKDILDKEEQKQTLVKPQSSSNNAFVPQDEFNRGTPRSTLYGYLSACQEGDFETASQFLDYRNLKSETLALGKAELARHLYTVINRTTWIDLIEMSDSHLGHDQDALPSYRDLLANIDTKQGSVKLLLQRVPRVSDKEKIWKISNATVAIIPELNKEFAYTPFGEWLAHRTPVVSFLGVMLWQWVYFILMLIVYFVAAKVFTWLLSRTLKSIYPKLDAAVQAFIEKPISLLLTIILARSLIAPENMTLAAKAVSEGATLLILAWLWVFFKLIDLSKILLSKRFIEKEKPLAVYLLRPAGTVAKCVFTLVALLVWFENLGFSATTLLAGLGIGGLAIALAAQKTVENIIGAITLYTSAPVKIGNLCKFGHKLGVVEEIGLRATRVRTLDRTVIYVANAQFVDMQLENFSERERIAFRPKMYLQPCAKKQQLENLLNDITELLKNHPKVDAQPLRAHFKQFNKFGLELDILAYIDTLDFDEYLCIINSINLEIYALIEKNNCQLAVISGAVDSLLRDG